LYVAPKICPNEPRKEYFHKSTLHALLHLIRTRVSALSLFIFSYPFACLQKNK